MKEGAMSSFGFMCKALVYSIQNRLLYLPAKYQGRATAWTRVISKFQLLLKMKDCTFILAICDLLVCSRHLEKAFCQAGEWLCTHTENFHTNYYYYGEADVCTAGPCSAAFYLGVDFGLFVVNLENLESVDILFWFVLILY